MKNLYKIAIAVIAISIILGAASGFLVQENQPKDQVFTFKASGFATSTPVHCPGIPQNFSTWLQILVIGNRTGMNFLSTEVFGQGQIQLNLPLNETAYAYFNPVNSTLEKIDVPLSGYFGGGDSLVVSVNYYINGFSPTTFTIGKTAMTSLDFSC